jgi:hypothetical protein
MPYTYGITGTSIDEFRDVTLATLADGQILRYDASTQQWRNATIEEITTVLDSLADVGLTSPTAGQVLQFDGTSWVNANASIDDLSDVALTSATTGQVLRWDGTQFVNANPSIDDLSDVGLTSTTTGQVLQWDGTQFVNANPSIDALSDVGLTSTTTGQVLQWDGTQFVNANPSIDALSDVGLTNPTNGDVLQYNNTNGQWENVPSSNVGATTLDGLSDVTAPTPTSGDFLKWNGSAWVNDDIDLGTDTTGNYVADVTAGTGISVTHTPSEGSTATVAINATIDNLSDVTINATREWAGPYIPITGVGAPDPGTGNVGDYYVETASFPASLANIKLYGPKAASGTIWPLLGTTGVDLTAIGDANPVGYAHNGSGTHVLRVNFASGTPTIASAWGPYVAAGFGERSVITYDQLTGEWADTSWRFVSAVDGGNWAALTSSVSGGTSILTRGATVHAITLTGNITSSGIGRPRLNVVTPSNDTGAWNARAAVIHVALIQGGSGGYTYAWPAAVVWPGGVAPTLSTRVGDVDMFQLTTWDNGTTWYGVQVASGASRNNISSVSAKTADYTLTRADVGNTVVLDSASTGYTFTIPTNTTAPLPNGVTITVATVNDGDLTIAGAGGVTVNGTTRLTTKGEFAQLVKTDTNTWLVSTPTYRTEQVNTQSAAYTFVASDAGNIVSLDDTTNRDFTVPTNANVPFPVGTRITVIAANSGHLTVVGDTGVTVTGSGNLNSAGQIGSLVKLGTDSWVVHH